MNASPDRGVNKSHRVRQKYEYDAGVNVGERWEDVRELVRPCVDDHTLIFNDYHLLWACQGLKDEELTSKFQDSLQEFVR